MSDDDQGNGEDPAEPPTPPKGTPTGRWTGRWRRRLLVALALTGLVLVPLCGRVAFEGRAEIDRADEAAEAGDVDGEILHLGRAARWRAPLLSHDEAARDRLLEIGRAAEARGVDDDHIALAAFREVRRGLLATRTFAVSDPDQLQEANEAIARLMAAQEVRFGTDVGGSGDPEAWHLQRLSEPPGPVPWRATVAALAFVLWLGATAGFVTRGLDAAGRLRPKSALRWGVAGLALLVTWAVMLVRVRG